MKTRLYRTLMMLSMMAVSYISSAQALPFVSADYNPATLAKGTASLTSTSSIAYSAFSNAAAIPFSELNADFSAGFTMWAPSGATTDVVSVAGAYNVKQKLGIAVGLNYGTNPAYDIYDANGSLKGSFSPNQMQISAGLSYCFLPFMSVGANVGYATSTLAEGSSYGSLVADVFLMAKLGGFKAAAGVSDLGGGVTSASGVKFSIPTAASLGLGYDAQIGEKNVVELMLDADYYLSGALAAGFGASYTYAELLSLRAGYRYGGKSVIPSFLSLGAGALFKGINIDIAYLIASGDSPVGNTLSLSLGYRF